MLESGMNSKYFEFVCEFQLNPSFLKKKNSHQLFSILQYTFHLNSLRTSLCDFYVINIFCILQIYVTLFFGILQIHIIYFLSSPDM